MKYIKIIPIHSFVDIITNSSTELFTADTNKDVEAVKEILQDIIDWYNTRNDCGYTMDIFGSIFKFSSKDFYKYVTDDDYEYDNPYNMIKGWFCDDSTEGIIAKRKDNIEHKPYVGWYNGKNNATTPYDTFKDYFKKECGDKSTWDKECRL